MYSSSSTPGEERKRKRKRTTPRSPKSDHLNKKPGKTIMMSVLPKQHAILRRTLDFDGREGDENEENEERKERKEGTKRGESKGEKDRIQEKNTQEKKTQEEKTPEKKTQARKSSENQTESIGVSLGDGSIPPQRDNSSVISFESLSGHRQFLTKIDCQEILRQPHAFISSDSLVWLMTSVGRDKYDPSKHYLFDEMHLSSMYMRAQPPNMAMSQKSAESLFKADIVVYMPLHFEEHFSLVVIEGLSRFLSCVKGKCCECSPLKVINAFHYDSLALSTTHKVSVVKGAVSGLILHGLRSNGHSCSQYSIEAHIFITRITKKKDQPAGHVTCGPFVALYFKQHLHNTPMQSSKERRELLMDMLTNHQHEVALRYGSFLRMNGVENLQRSPTAVERRRNYSLDSIADEIDVNYYRIEFGSVMESKSPVDLLQLCNHWIDKCLWTACGKDKELFPRREESDRSLLKTEFKVLYADKVKKGAKIRSDLRKKVLWLSMGAVLQAADSAYTLPGGDASENVFIAMRTYPQSEVWCNASDLLFNIASCKKITFEEDGVSVKGAPLQKYVRILFTLFQRRKKTAKHFSKHFTSQGLVIMQEVSVHVVAIVEYVLQCIDVAVFEFSDSASKKDNAVGGQFDNISVIESRHVPHRNSGRFVQNSQIVSEAPFGKPTFLRMRKALQMAASIMKVSGSRLIQAYKTDSEQISRVGRKGKINLVHSSYLLGELPRAVLAETLSAIENELKSVLGCSVGTGTLNGIQKLFRFSNDCFAASHGLDSVQPIVLASLRDPDSKPEHEQEIFLVDVEEPKRNGPQERKGDKKSQDDRRSKLSKKTKEGLASSQPLSATLSLKFSDSARTLMRFRDVFSPIEMIYVPCVFELLFSVLHLRHAEDGWKCKSTCPKKSSKLLKEAFTSFLKWKQHGWMSSNMNIADVFRLERLRDTIVRGSMNIGSVRNLQCIGTVISSKTRNDGTLDYSCHGQEGTDKSGRTIRWAGKVIDIRQWSQACPYETWKNSSSVAIGEICFPSGGKNRKLSTANLVVVEVFYELQWSSRGREVPIDARGREFDFMELDFVGLSFLDTMDGKHETRFGMLLEKPERVDDNKESHRRVRVAVLNDEGGVSQFGYFKNFISFRKGRDTNTELVIRKIGSEGIHQDSKMFDAIWKGFFKMDRFKILGLSDPCSLAYSYAQRFWDMVSMIQWVLVQENANAQGPSTRKTIDHATVQHGAALCVNPCDVAKRTLAYARKSISEVVQSMGTTVNESQLEFLVSWCSHITAYHLLSPTIQRSFFDNDQCTGPGKKGDENFSSSMFFCQGPPGTGKSHVVTILVWATTRKALGSLVISGSGDQMYRDSSVSSHLTGRALVLTVTNAAIDDLLMKYLAGVGNDIVSEYSPLRLGSMSTERIAQQFEIYRLSRDENLRPDALINNKRATFSTLGSAMSYDWNQNIRGFDLIVIDEAAYACETETTAVLARILDKVGEPMLGTSVVLVGDQAQLPPFDDKTFACWTEHRARTPHLFSKAMSVMSMKPSFPEETSRQHTAMWEQTPQVMFQFQKQMRSAPSIGRYVSDNFYAGKIGNGPRSTQRYWVTAKCMQSISSDRFPLRTVNFVNTKQNYVSHARNMEVQDEKRRGYKNEYECDIILEMLQEWNSASPSQRMTIGILTPYVLQKTFISQALEKAGIRNAQVLTFASAQGKEFDIVILSLVRTYVENSRSAGTRSRQLSFLDDKHSACVAISRAREVLIVLGKLQKIAIGSPRWRQYFTSHRHFPQTEESEFKDFMYLEPIYKTYKQKDILTLAPETEPSF